MVQQFAGVIDVGNRLDYKPVMWYETVGLRTRPVSDQQKKNQSRTRT